MLVKIISIMLENTYTTDDLVERIGLMRKYYSERLFVEGSMVSLSNVLKSECQPHTLEALTIWERAFTESEIQPLIVYEALDTVQEELSTMPSVTLYVPVRFSQEQVAGIGQWFRDNVQPNILLSLRIDPRATGGCGFIWKNRYYNFSLHYFMQARREKMIEMFTTHMHESPAA